MKGDITDLNLTPYFILSLIPYIILIIYFLADKYFFPLALGKKQFIHKLQFEKEFEIYYYLWMKIAHFKEAAEKYFDLMPADEEEESEFYKPFVEEWEKVSGTITIREPFMAKEVYKQTEKLIGIPLETLAKFKNPIVGDRKELVRIRDEIFEICERIRDAIRKRITA